MIKALHAIPAGWNLAPAALISKSVSWFEDRGIAFEEAQDDMDALKLAPFFLKGVGYFAVMQYLNSPMQRATLMIDRAEADKMPLASVISDIADAFGLYPSDFTWRDSVDEPAVSPGAAEAIRRSSRAA